MERLTYRDKKGKAHIFCKQMCADAENCTDSYSVDLCQRFSAFSKLAEYEDLEEQGRLLRLPCKVGDFVYTILDEPYYSGYRMFGMDGRGIIKQRITEIHITSDGYYMSSKSCDESEDERRICAEGYKKTWFLSEEEANKKYQEIRAGYKVRKTHASCKYFQLSASGLPCCEFNFSAYLGEVCNRWEEKCDD